MASINGNMIVEKSRFLLGMKAPNYELGELKILDTYLARINARDPETQAVTFTKEEYEALMGFTDSRPETLKKRTEGLLGKVVTIPLEDGKKGWRKYTLFTKAECIQDEYGGYVVNLNCNPELQPVFFDVKHAGYLRYRLKNILPLNSKHSVLLYLYFKDNMFRQPLELSLRELREKLGIEKNKTYESFKYLKRDIIDKCVSEINELTDIDVFYERKTRGRVTVGLIFNVKGKPTQPMLEDDMEQLDMFDEGFLSEDSEELDRIEFFRCALKDDGAGLSNEQIDELQLAARQSEYATSMFPIDPTELDLKLHSYIMTQDRYTRSRAPKNYYAYLLQAIKENYAGYGNT